MIFRPFDNVEIRLCREDEISFDIVAKTGNIVAQNGNNVEATFDFVKRIVQLVAFDKVVSTLLLVWTVDGAYSIAIPAGYAEALATFDYRSNR